MAENSFKRTRSFRTVVAQYEGAYITAFSPGYTVPASPADYQKNLAGEAASQLAWVDWSEPQAVIEDLVFQSVLKYSIFYGQQVAAPLPSNPTPEYAAWYAGAKGPGAVPNPFVGTVSGQ